MVATEDLVLHNKSEMIHNNWIGHEVSLICFLALLYVSIMVGYDGLQTTHYTILQMAGTNK